VGSRAAVLSLAGGLAAAISACGQPEPLRVGFVSGLTGRHYDLGISSRNGVQLAAAEINASGGIGGRPLEILVRDDEQKTDAARAAVEDLIRVGVVAIIGHATSSMVEATIPIVDREHVLMVSPTVGAGAFRGQDDWFVSLYPSTAETASLLAGWVNRGGARPRVAILYDLSNRAYTQSWHDQFGAEHERYGGTLAASIPFDSGEVASWSGLASRALAARPDAVLLVANALDSAALAQQLRKVRPGLQLLGTEWGFTHDVLAQGGKAVEGAIVMEKVNVNDAAPRYRRFQIAYEARFNRPVDFAAVFAYEATQLLAEALRRDPTRPGVRAAVLGMKRFPGLQADFTLDRFGDVHRSNFVMTVRDGRMALLE